MATTPPQQQHEQTNIRDFELGQLLNSQSMSVACMFPLAPVPLFAKVKPPAFLLINRAMDQSIDTAEGCLPAFSLLSGLPTNHWIGNPVAIDTTTYDFTPMFEGIAVQNTGDVEGIGVHVLNELMKDVAQCKKLLQPAGKIHFATDQSTEKLVFVRHAYHPIVATLAGKQRVLGMVLQELPHPEDTENTKKALKSVAEHIRNAEAQDLVTQALNQMKQPHAKGNQA